MKELYEPMLYDASADETEKLRKRHEGLMEQLSQAEEKVRELNRMKVHESFAVTKLTKELLDECMESIEVHPGGQGQDQLEIGSMMDEGLLEMAGLFF